MQTKRSRGLDLIKRAGDVLISGGLLVLLVPVFAVIAALIAVKMGRPIIFKQMRPGRHEQPFFIYKYRTMIDTIGTGGPLLSDAKRLTDFGRWLRHTSLDELPELFNVLKGDMSLVGPRPLLMHYLPLYSPIQKHRHEVKPGMTGWAQVNGRNALKWEEKFILDVWYVNNISFVLDIEILALTVLKVFRREGISHPGQATMGEFTENSE